MESSSGTKVVVTTEYRGVFFGELARRYGAEVTLKDARNCIYWSQETRGFLGLAATGPLDGSRVGPCVPELTLTRVTSITACSPAAIERWESGPWN